jgi:hypothetical protein
MEDLLFYHKINKVNALGLYSETHTASVMVGHDSYVLSSGQINFIWFKSSQQGV